MKHVFKIIVLVLSILSIIIILFLFNKIRISNENLSKTENELYKTRIESNNNRGWKTYEDPSGAFYVRLPFGYSVTEKTKYDLIYISPVNRAGDYPSYQIYHNKKGNYLKYLEQKNEFVIANSYYYNNERPVVTVICEHAYERGAGINCAKSGDKFYALMYISDGKEGYISLSTDGNIKYRDKVDFLDWFDRIVITQKN